MTFLNIDATPDGYSPEQIKSTMTVKELIAALKSFSDDTPVYLSFNGGYSYGAVKRPYEAEGSFS